MPPIHVHGLIMCPGPGPKPGPGPNPGPGIVAINAAIITAYMINGIAIAIITARTAFSVDSP